jgi:hypothetical protein
METIPLSFVGPNLPGAHYLQENIPSVGASRLLSQAEVRNALEPWYYITPMTFLWWIEAWHYARRHFYYKEKNAAKRKLMKEFFKEY